MPAAKNVSKKKVASPSETDYLQRVEEDMRALKNTAASLQTTINLLQDDIMSFKNEVGTFKKAMANDVKRIVEHISRG